MGKRGQGHKPKHNNLSKDEKQLHESVDKLLRISTVPRPGTVVKALECQKEIQAITEDIIRLQEKLHKSDSVDNRASGVIVEKLVEWATENGADLNGCSISEFEGYDLGLKVEKDIARSSLVVAIPRRLMLTVETANKSGLKPLLENDQILKNMPNVALSIFLLTEKFKENSFWKPYIDALPKKYSTVLYFTVEELEELKGSPTLDMALKQIKSIARQYAYFYKLFHTSDDPVSRLMRTRFTYKEYCWAVSTIMTRQNTVPSEDGKGIINALIPLWDICNHANGAISTDYNPERNRSECLALRDFKIGEQLFIFYGARTNADLFVHNGFVYEENEHDAYSLRLGVSKSDPLREKRTALLEKLSIQSTGDFFVRRGSRPVDEKLLAFLRIFNMNEEQLQHWLESDKAGDLQHLDCALDTALDNKSWSFLQARLALLLKTYATSLEEDEKLLKDSAVSSNKLLALKMRVTEKRIIAAGVDYCQQRIRQ